MFLQEREPIFIAVKFGGNEVRFLFSFSSAKENKAQIGLWWLVFGLTVCSTCCTAALIFGCFCDG